MDNGSCLFFETVLYNYCSQILVIIEVKILVQFFKQNDYTVIVINNYYYNSC